MEQIEAFVIDLKKRVIVGKVIINPKLYFDGGEMEHRTHGSIRMSVFRYLERLKPITLSSQAY